MRFLTRDKIDDSKWDECINSSFNGMVYGYTWFLDIVAENWAGLVSDDYQSVFPLPFKTRLGIQIIYQPFFTQQLGLFSNNLISEEKVLGAFQAIPPSFKLISLNLNTHNKASGRTLKIHNQLNHELDLINPYSEIRERYSQNLKRNLKKSEEAKLSFVKNIKPDGVVELFRSNKGRGIRHLHSSDYYILKKLIYTSIYKGKMKVYGVYNKTNELVAGACFLISNNKAIFIFSGLSEEGRKSAAMPFLIDSFIKEHSNRHLTFDFDGSNDPNLARFYKSFGSKECYYSRIEMSRLPWLLNILYKSRKKIFNP